MNIDTVVDEVLFKRLLSLEKRRCERTGVPFALVLVHLEELGGALDRNVVEQMAVALGDAMRETDITGWYQDPSTIGIILTTLNGSDRPTLESVIVERSKAVLSAHLDPKQMDDVWISFHVFPEDANSHIFYLETDSGSLKKKNPGVLKRAMDVTGSLAAVVALSPVFAAIALLIKVTSRGPVFFRQKRVGQFGREFTFLKFRSMYVNNDPTIHKEYIRKLIEKKLDGPAGTFKIKNDPRITRIGRFIRKTSLDELPQFFNVLKGEMSLVGPRPPIPYEFESYSLWHRRRITEAKPGITGEWQVHGRSRTTFDDMVRMDLRYVRNQSFWLDLKILLKTPFAVFSGDGAY